MAFPFPSMQSVPDKIMGDIFFFVSLFIQSSYLSFDTGLLSPVKLLSSIFIPFPSISNKSAGIISPIEIRTISPTNRSSAFKSMIFLSLIVLKKVPVFFNLFKS